MPAVTVLMSVYNSEKYLSEAMESILNQTFADFEFLIIDDCSTDSSVTIIKSYDDHRIRLIHNDQNMGLTKSLNKGLMLATGKYIARMDADDVSYLRRFQEQVDYLEQHPEVVLCGSWRVNMKIDKDVPFAPPEKHDDILILLLLEGNVLGHPGVMFRREALQQNELSYYESYQTCQDYDLWLKVSRIGKLHILPKFLINYRVHEQTVSSQKTDLQKQTRKLIVSTHLEELGLSGDQAKVISDHVHYERRLNWSNYLVTRSAIKYLLKHSESFISSKKLALKVLSFKLRGNLKGGTLKKAVFLFIISMDPLWNLNFYEKVAFYYHKK